MARRVSSLAVGVLAAVVLLGVARARADDPPAAPAGPTYKNPDLGISVEAPAGWRMVADKADVPAWVRLCSFADAPSGAVAVVSARRATAVTLARLRAEITKAYGDDATFRVAAVTDIGPGTKRPWPGLLVDAVQTRPADPPPPGVAPPPTPPPPVAWRVNAAYYLGGDTEYLLYVQARATLWSRVQAVVDKMIQGFSVKAQGPANAPRGEGAYRDDRVGFSCRFPSTHGVRLPVREEALVEFAPAGDGPVLGVFRYESGEDLEHEAKKLVDYYTGSEVGGEATTGTLDVAGRTGALVTAKGRIGGRDQVFFVAVVQRDKDTFRLRAAGDETQEAATKAAFDALVKSFALTNP